MCACAEYIDAALSLYYKIIVNFFRPQIKPYVDIIIISIINTQMVAVALGPWASHSEDRAEP